MSLEVDATYEHPVTKEELTILSWEHHPFGATVTVRRANGAETQFEWVSMQHWKRVKTLREIAKQWGYVYRESDTADD
jgi:hypothetical protein